MSQDAGKPKRSNNFPGLQKELQKAVLDMEQMEDDTPAQEYLERNSDEGTSHDVNLSPEFPKRCPKCGKKYKHNGYYKRHILWHESNQRDMTTNPGLIAVPKEPILTVPAEKSPQATSQFAIKEGIHKCIHCHKTFLYTQALQRHLLVCNS